MVGLRMIRRLAPVAVAALALGLSACGGSSGSASSTATSASRTTSAAAAAGKVPPGPVVATLHAVGHSPKVGKWPITVTLTKGGRPIAGHVSYAFLFNGQVVSKQPVTFESPNFVGVFHDQLIFPARAVGIPLTLRIIIQTPYGVTNINYPVKVQA